MNPRTPALAIAALTLAATLGVTIAACSAPAPSPAPTVMPDTTASAAPERADPCDAVRGQCGTLRVVTDSDLVRAAWDHPMEMVGLWAAGTPPIDTGTVLCLTEVDPTTIVASVVDPVTRDFVEPWQEWAVLVDRAYDWPGYNGMEYVK